LSGLGHSFGVGPGVKLLEEVVGGRQLAPNLREITIVLVASCCRKQDFVLRDDGEREV